jgi:chemotaxis protein MotB
MYLNRVKHNAVKHDNVHRWLVSYADYMTLLFALFVVLYAMAMVNEKPYDSIKASFASIFQNGNQSNYQNAAIDLLPLPVNKNTNQKIIVESKVDLATSQNTQIVNTQLLSDVVKQKLGADLGILAEELKSTLKKLLDTGFVKLLVNGDWLEIELSSGLLFPSGSSSATTSAKVILSEIKNVIGKSNNFIRVRGYTDDQLISNEIFSSNWELSVFRATAILKELEMQGINPARMAVEGYGQYYPSENNLTAEGRAKNRRVVIALSKYGLQIKQPVIAQKALLNQPDNIAEQAVKNFELSNRINVIRLDNGGIRITTDNEQVKDIETVETRSN